MKKSNGCEVLVLKKENRVLNRSFPVRMVRCGKKVLKVYTTDFVGASSLVPRNFVKLGFWAEFSKGLFFSWGNNNRTMITAKRFADHCQNIMDDLEGVSPKSKDTFIQMLRDLGKTNIDLNH